MKIGVIDLGSNSVILTIAEKINSQIRSLFERSIITRIGKNIEKNKKLDPFSKKNTIKVLKEYKNIANNLGVDRIVCFATDALRDAADSKDFIQEVYEKTQIGIKIISGVEEAKLTFHAVTKEFQNIGDRFLSLDVGGGSVEFIKGSPDKIEIATSIKTGAIRIKNRFNIQDRIDKKTSEEISEFIKNLLPDINLSHDFIVVASGGTITTLQAINLKLERFEHEKVHKSKVVYEEMLNLFNYLNSIPFKIRIKIPCLNPGRADIIHIGALIFLSIIEKYNIKSMYVSNRGVRWGFIYKLLD